MWWCDFSEMGWLHEAYLESRQHCLIFHFTIPFYKKKKSPLKISLNSPCSQYVWLKWFFATLCDCLRVNEMEETVWHMSQSSGTRFSLGTFMSLFIQHCKAVSFYEMPANVQQQMTLAAKEANMTRQRHMSANKLRWLIASWNCCCLPFRSFLS